MESILRQLADNIYALMMTGGAIILLTMYVKSVNGKIDSKLDSDKCDERHNVMTKGLEKGDERFNEIQKDIKGIFESQAQQKTDIEVIKTQVLNIAKVINNK